MREKVEIHTEFSPTVSLGVLHLDNVGTEICQKTAGTGGGNEGGQIHNFNAFQWFQSKSSLFFS